MDDRADHRRDRRVRRAAGRLHRRPDPLTPAEGLPQALIRSKTRKTTLEKAQPGLYVVRVSIFDGIQATWNGSGTLKPLAPAAPAPTATPPTPFTTPLQSKPPKTKPASAKERRDGCKKKAKRIKNKEKRAKAMKRCEKIR